MMLCRADRSGVLTEVLKAGVSRAQILDVREDLCTCVTYVFRVRSEATLSASLLLSFNRCHTASHVVMTAVFPGCSTLHRNNSWCLL